MTRTDTVVRTEGMTALLEKLGEVDAERFITLMIREPFDYTKWREIYLITKAWNLWRQKQINSAKVCTEFYKSFFIAELFIDV